MLDRLPITQHKIARSYKQTLNHVMKCYQRHFPLPAELVADPFSKRKYSYNEIRDAILWRTELGGIKLEQSFPQVVAVTKYSSFKDVFALIVAGQQVFGENYLQGLQQKTFLLAEVQHILRQYTWCQKLIRFFSTLRYPGLEVTDYSEEDRKRQLREFWSKNGHRFAHKGLTEEQGIQLLEDLSFIEEYHSFMADAASSDDLESRLSHVKFHMIGHVQSRKAEKIVPLVDMVETVDSEKLARKLNEARQKQYYNYFMEEIASHRMQEHDRTLDILIQLVSPERDEAGHGIDTKKLWPLVEYITKECSFLRIRGLMFIASTENKPEEYRYAHEVFQVMKQYYPDLKLDTLSMGMSDSIDVALQHHSTHLRVGTALFTEDYFPETETDQTQLEQVIASTAIDDAADLRAIASEVAQAEAEIETTEEAPVYCELFTEPLYFNSGYPIYLPKTIKPISLNIK